MSMQDFGKYAHFEWIGAGSFGEVYRAEDTNLERAVAIKFLKPWPASDPTEIARFLREGKRMAKLNNPCVVTVHEVGETPDQKQPYIVMELIDGKTLETYLDDQKNGRLSVEQALPIIRDVAQALTEAHAKGVLHRDVKPDNIFVTASDRTAKLGDFGLAKEIDPNSAKGDSYGSIVGTVEYLAPEARKGKYSEHSDVYALGMVSYRMLAGKTRHHSDKPLHKINRTVPRALTAVINNATDADPKARPISAAEFAVAVEMARGKPFYVRPVNMVLAVLVVGILAWFGFRRWQPTPIPIPPGPTAITVVLADTPTPTATDTSAPTSTPTLRPMATATPTFNWMATQTWEAHTQETTVAATLAALPTSASTLMPTPTSTPTPTPNFRATSTGEAQIQATALAATLTALPTDTPTATPSATPLPTSTATPTPDTGATATVESRIRETAIAATLTALPTSTPTATWTPTPTETVTPTPTPNIPATATREALIRATALAATLTAMPTDTPTRSPTRTPSPTARPTATPTPTQTPTRRPTATPTPRRTNTPTPTPALPKATINGNGLRLREGPGINYPVLQTYAEGTSVELLGVNPARSWVKARMSDAREGWMSVEFLDMAVSIASLPVLAVPPTPTPTKTPVATNTPTPCRISVDSDLSAMWDRGTLGCAINRRYVVWSSYTPYQYGSMIWREDTQIIYGFFNQGSWWTSVRDVWTDGMAIPSRNVSPPPGYQIPVRGTGYVWATNDTFYRNLGFAAAEQQGFCATIQDFERGAIMRTNTTQQKCSQRFDHINPATYKSIAEVFMRILDNGAWTRR